jgi:hypothetical protein
MVPTSALVIFFFIQTSYAHGECFAVITILFKNCFYSIKGLLKEKVCQWKQRNKKEEKNSFVYDFENFAASYAPPMYAPISTFLNNFIGRPND